MKTILISALALTIATGAMAKPGGQQVPEFGALDLNGDGTITMVEFEETRAAKFTARDANGDGFLDASEMAGASGERGQGAPDQNLDAGERVAKLMERADEDGDGQLSTTEVKGPFVQVFTKMDTDGNGFLSPVEMETAMLQRADGDGTREDRPERDTGQMITRADKDGDGMLSPEEMDGGKTEKLFARMDADGDGSVTQAEWDEAIANRGARRATN